MFGLGFTELLFLAVLGLILIGPKQLPEIARTVGRMLNELKRTTDGFKSDLNSMASNEIRRSEYQAHIKPETPPSEPANENASGESVANESKDNGANDNKAEEPKK